MAFRGQFDYSLDAKNRLNVPPKFRAALSEGLVLAKWFEPCVAIWTPQGFEQFLDTYLEGLPRRSSEHRKLTRYFAQNSWDAELDGSGRVTLNPKLLEHAGIERAVTVGGNDDHIQVWEPGRWREDQERLSAEIPGLGESDGHPS